MKLNKWTVALAATGVVSLASAVQAEESHPVNTLLSSTTLSGYVDTSAIWNTASGSQVANRFSNTGSDRQDGFNLNLVKVQLEKPVDEGTWSAGYHVETVFGPDAASLPGRLGGAGTQVALKQAYVALRAPVGNGIDFKIGQYDTIIGYEVTDSYANPNFARSFGFGLEPLGHLGILASYQITDAVGISGGIANTGNLGLTSHANGANRIESQKSYLGAVTLKAPDSWGWLAGSSLYAGVIDNGAAGGLSASNAANTESSNALNLYVGASLSTPIKELSVGAAYDYLANGYGTFKGSYANATAVYASYQLTKEIKLNNRVEYATSSGGVFSTVAAPGAPIGTYSGGYSYFSATGSPIPAAAGSKAAEDQQIFGDTFTVDYALWANVVTRLEFRWDHSLRNVRAFDGKVDDFSVAANVIYKF